MLSGVGCNIRDDADATPTGSEYAQFWEASMPQAGGLPECLFRQTKVAKQGQAPRARLRRQLAVHREGSLKIMPSPLLKHRNEKWITTCHQWESLRVHRLLCCVSCATLGSPRFRALQGFLQLACCLPHFATRTVIPLSRGGRTRHLYLTIRTTDISSFPLLQLPSVNPI